MSKAPLPESKLYKFRNCRLLWKSSIVTEDLWVRDGKILNPRSVFWEECKTADVEVDCGNLIIAPGFIELQLNGKYSVQSYYGQYYHTSTELISTAHFLYSLFIIRSVTS